MAVPLRGYHHEQLSIGSKSEKFYELKATGFDGGFARRITGVRNRRFDLSQ